MAEKPFFDSFGWTTNAVSDLPLRYVSVSPSSSIKTSGGPFDGRYFDCGGSAGLVKSIPTPSAAVLVQGYWMVSSLGVTLLHVNDSATQQTTLNLTAAGELQILRGTASQLQITSGLGILTNQWHYIVFRVFVDDSGQWEVLCDGATVLSGTGDTKSLAFTGGGITLVYLAKNASCNLASPIIDWGANFAAIPAYPEKRAIFCSVSAVVDNTWTPNAGTNLEAVDDTAQDGDTTYSSDSTVGHSQSYNYDVPTLPVSPGIVAVQALHLMRKDDAGARTVMPFSNASDASGAASLGDTYSFVVDQRLVDPDTGAAWASGADVEGTKFGVRVAS